MKQNFADYKGLMASVNFCSCRLTSNPQLYLNPIFQIYNQANLNFKQVPSPGYQ